MNKNLAKLKVILTALPTYLIAAAAIVAFVADRVAEVLPDQAAGVVQWSATVVAFIGAVVQIIRKVSPVLPSQVGLLPQGPPAPPLLDVTQNKGNVPLETPGGQHDGGNQ